MKDRPIHVYCDCCGAEVEIHPSHAKYHQLKFEVLRELHPEVADDEPLESPQPEVSDDEVA